MNDKELESPGPTVVEELRGAPPPPPCAVDAGEKKERAGAAPPAESVGEKEESPSQVGAAGPPAQSGGGDKDEAVDAAAVGGPSDGGGKRKDGILGPIGGDRRVAVPEEKDGIVGGELMAVSEAAVAEERKQAAVGGEFVVVAEASVAGGDEKKKKDGLLGADSGVTIAVAGSGGEKGLERKEGDGVVTVAIAPRKQGIPRTSCYHGVTRHRWTGKYEAHLWDGSINIESRKRKGKQVYLGGYDTEEKAARAYDLAALKYWGVNAGTKLNFPISDYEKELEEMKNMNQDEWVAYLRRRSTCFSRGVSAFRGVTRRKDGKWQARLGSVAGTRDIYLGAFNTEEEAAVAYDIAAVELRGPTAVTNFDISNYLEGDVRRLEATPSVKL